VVSLTPQRRQRLFSVPRPSFLGDCAKLRPPSAVFWSVISIVLLVLPFYLLHAPSCIPTPTLPGRSLGTSHLLIRPAWMTSFQVSTSVLICSLAFVPFQPHIFYSPNAVFPPESLETSRPPPRMDHLAALAESRLRDFIPFHRLSRFAKLRAAMPDTFRFRSFHTQNSPRLPSFYQGLLLSLFLCRLVLFFLLGASFRMGFRFFFPSFSVGVRSGFA